MGGCSQIPTMRYFHSYSILFVVLFFLGTVCAEGQDSSPLKSLFSKKADTEGRSADRAKRDSSTKERKKSSGLALFSSSSKGSLLGGPKRVEINLTDQKLRAYQGSRLVFKTNISSGKNRRTPTGNFRAGPYKSETHFSSLYHNAPMPWSVQVSGNVFVHGSSSVPNYPASHGCVRVPITGNNPAKRFFKWVDVGTPISIAY